MPYGDSKGTMIIPIANSQVLAHLCMVRVKIHPEFAFILKYYLCLSSCSYYCISSSSCYQGYTRGTHYIVLQVCFGVLFIYHFYM